MPSRRRRLRAGLVGGALLVLAIIVVVGGICYIKYLQHVEKTSELQKDYHEDEKRRMELEIQKVRSEHGRAMAKVETRLAVLEVLDQRESVTDPGLTDTTLRWQELGQDGRPIGEPRVVRLPGRFLGVNSLTLQFDDQSQFGSEFIGRSVAFFDRVVTEEVPHRAGYRLDSPGRRPSAYEIPDFQQTELRITRDDYERVDEETWQQVWRDVGTGKAGGAPVTDTEKVLVQRPETGGVYGMELRAGGVDFRVLTDRNGRKRRVSADELRTWSARIDRGEIPLSVARTGYFDVAFKPEESSTTPTVNRGRWVDGNQAQARSRRSSSHEDAPAEASLVGFDDLSSTP